MYPSNQYYEDLRNKNMPSQSQPSYQSTPSESDLINANMQRWSNQAGDYWDQIRNQLTSMGGQLGSMFGNSANNIRSTGSQLLGTFNPGESYSKTRTSTVPSISEAGDNDLLDTMTPEAIDQLKFLIEANRAGGISNEDFNTMAMSLIFSNPKKKATEEQQAKLLEDQMKNLELGQYYQQMGDPITAESYLRESLPNNLRGTLNTEITTNKNPSYLDRFIGFLNAGPKNPFDVGGFIKGGAGWQDPGKYGVNRREGEGDLSYLVNALLYGTSDTRNINDPNFQRIKKLNEMYNKYPIY